MRMIRVDCHVHTAFSGDARILVDEIGHALDEGVVDVVCVTDHNSIRGGEAAAERWPDRVVVGSEIRTWAGEIIGLFLTAHVPRRASPVEVCEMVRAQGGLVYVPHPFCPLHNGLRPDVLDGLVADGLVDIVEVFNGKATANAEAARYSEAHGLAAGAGSDAHYPEFIGRGHVEMPPFDGPVGFLAALRDGSIHGRPYAWSEARWRTKLVP